MTTAPAPSPPPSLRLVVLDFEGSGLNVSQPPYDVHNRFAHSAVPHVPCFDGGDYRGADGSDPDCILEVAAVVLEATPTLNAADLDDDINAPPRVHLTELARGTWCVLPPNVKTVGDFDTWATLLRERNPFCHTLHSKPGVPDADDIAAAAEAGLPRPVGTTSLLDTLRLVAGHPQAVVDCQLVNVEAALIEMIAPFSPAYAKSRTPGAKPLRANTADLIFTGNSIANYDIPLMQLWMPRLFALMNYRIMDVSVLRTFYVTLAGVELPAGLAESIKSGSGGHRALGDAAMAADNLKALVRYARGAADSARIGRLAPRS